ncbi:hypothetical protein LUX57_08580 [Actinomadura madurae]|uniref:hypothetical protein n=1 Tax=Actinomadura madurae TaxID=1993 RepID=UPI0020D212D8|nr:hypothetical protein [Actinomadura madurae]MCP9965184.1 hypothetical protein [Actinomadura madurae]
MNSSAYRAVPNWSLSCSRKTVSSLPWMSDALIDGSNTSTFGPRSPPPGSVPPPEPVCTAMPNSE